MELQVHYQPIHEVSRGVVECVEALARWTHPTLGLLDPARFYIFSGGKIEYRKGQDLVLLAFREFSRMHPEAVLVTAWHSPWPDISVGFKGRLDAPLQSDPAGRIDIKRWVAENGIDPKSVIEIFAVPNQLMPGILREMDVALQPSRAEACTNLPVKEAMACNLRVVSTDVGDVRELFAGQPGYAVCEPTAASIADCLRRVLADPPPAEARRAVEHLRIDRIARRVIAEYEKVLDKRKGTRQWLGASAS